MNDNESKETIFKPRAANTTATLKPTEVTGKQYENASEGPLQIFRYEKVTDVPEAGEPFARPTNAVNLALKSVQKTDSFTKHELDREVNRFNGVLTTPSLEARVTKIEEQLDSLLDRIAKHNLRSQHRI